MKGNADSSRTIIEAVNEQKIADVDGTAGVEDIYLWGCLSWKDFTRQ